MDIIERILERAKQVRDRIGKYRSEKPYSFRLAVLGVVMAGFFLSVVGYFAMQPPTMSITSFITALNEGKVSEATVIQSQSNYNITASVDGGKAFVKAPTGPVDMNGTKEGLNILQVMNSSGVDVEIVNGFVNSFAIVMALLMPFIFVAGVLYLVSVSIRGNNAAWMEVVKKVGVRFSDVAGADEAKGELSEVLDFLSGKLSFEATKARIPRGVLLSGPPGTGKTLLAKALAGEAEASFIAVSGSDFKSMWYGGSARRVRGLFEYARANKPCIVFIDEFDAIGGKRSKGGSSIDKETDATLNQLLVEMDGFKDNDGIMIVAATNLRENLDPAVTRPGRLDRLVEVGLPDQNGRAAILRVHTAGHPLADDVDLETVARGTPGFSGAEISNLVNEAAIFAGRRSSATISSSDFEKAKNKVIMGLERRSLVLTDHEMKLTAVHEAGHALAACLCPHSDPVHRATIVPHGRSLGMVVRLPERDRVSVPLAKLRDDLTVLMAGRAAESTVFGEDSVTTGASADIEMATSTARDMVLKWGMSEKVGMVRVSEERAAHDTVVEEEIRSIIHAAYKRAVDMLEANRATLDRLGEALLSKETLEGNEIRQIVFEPETQKAVA